MKNLWKILSITLADELGKDDNNLLMLILAIHLHLPPCNTMHSISIYYMNITSILQQLKWMGWSHLCNGTWNYNPCIAPGYTHHRTYVWLSKRSFDIRMEKKKSQNIQECEKIEEKKKEEKKHKEGKKRRECVIACKYVRMRKHLGKICWRLWCHES